MTNPIIQIKNLSFSIAGTPILSNISLDIEEGDYVSIIGPNGAGKTTLIKCIAGIHTHWTGTIKIGGTPFADLNNKRLAKFQSYVPQAEGRSNPLTVEDFVATGRYPHLSAFTSMQAEDYRAVDEALERAGLQTFRKRKMATLSGGERQMAFIAAALAQDTQILLLDEPSTFLDYRHQANVISILKSACKDQGKTVIAVHHDINTATNCSDQIHAIKNGALAFSGTSQETANPKTLKNIYDTPFKMIPSPNDPIPFICAEGAQ